MARIIDVKLAILFVLTTFIPVDAQYVVTSSQSHLTPTQSEWSYPPPRMTQIPAATVDSPVVATAWTNPRIASCGPDDYRGQCNSRATLGDAYGNCMGPDYGEYAEAYPDCYSGGVFMAPPQKIWGASVGVLCMTRDQQNSYTFSYDSANEAVQLVDARDANMDWAPGVELTLGQFDQCDKSGFVVKYWQLFIDEESTRALGANYAPGFLNGIRNYDQIDYSGGGAGDGVLASDNVNNAAIHQLSRDWQIYNFEVSRVILFSRGCGGTGCCGAAGCDSCGCAGRGTCDSAWSHSGMCGVRYVNYSEDMLFASDPNDTMIDYDADEYRIDIETDNQLLGFQLGGISERCISGGLSLRLAAKVGVFGNHINMDYFEGGTAGAATINNGPNNGRMLRYSGSKYDFATLGEMSIGLSYRVGCAWRLGADYRVLGVSGVAVPTDQLYFDTRGIQDVEQIDSSGGLILHGAFFRAEHCF